MSVRPVSDSVNNPSRTAPAEERVQTRASKAKDVFEKVLNKEIANEVQRFLHPYITGRITEEVETKEPRVPLILQLKKKYSKADPAKLEDVAFRAYVREAVRGSFLIKGEEGSVPMILKSLNQSLFYDFQRLSFDYPKLFRLIYEEKDAYVCQRQLEKSSFVVSEEYLQASRERKEVLIVELAKQGVSFTSQMQSS